MNDRTYTIGTSTTGSTTITGTGCNYATSTQTIATPPIFTYEPSNYQALKNGISKISIDPTSITFTIKDREEFTDIKEIVPFKVYLFTFGDDTKIKTIRDYSDEFDLEYMFYLALAKKIYSKTLTFEGVLNKTYELMYQKRYVKLVQKGIKLFNKIQEDKAKEEEKEEIKKRRHQKLIRKKQAAKERKREDKIDIIAEAIKRSKWEL